MSEPRIYGRTNMEQRAADTRSFFETCTAVLAAKGEDYSHTGEAFLDFEAIAHTLNMPREQVAMVLMMKHCVALGRWAGGDGMTNDSVRERLGDVANYCAILAAMDSEQRASITIPCDEERCSA